ncbi:MAG: hypothetical protein AAFP24_00435 [Pseudomonadota bacterium]
MKLTKAREHLSRLGLAAALCCGVASAAHADNTLTEAGTSVANTFTLSYSVSGTTQPDITNDTATTDPTAVVQGTPTTFTVDRKIDLTVTATNSVLSTPPGADATLTFELVNNGNDNAAYSFSIEDLDSGGTTFDATTLIVRYLIDANNNGSDDDGAYTVIAETAINAAAGSANVTTDVPKGDRVFIQVQGTIAAGIDDDSSDDITIVAETRDPAAFANVGETSATPAAVTTASGGANIIDGVAQNILADGTGVAASSDGDNDGLFAATGTIEVQSPDLEAAKTVEVIKEPDATGPITDCATASSVADSKAVPGACVEYVIEVENTGDTVSATDLTISDVLPDEVVFISATQTGFTDNGGGTGPTLNAPATSTSCDGTDTTCEVELTDSQLTAGNTGTITIRALIE